MWKAFQKVVAGTTVPRKRCYISWERKKSASHQLFRPDIMCLLAPGRRNGAASKLKHTRTLAVCWTILWAKPCQQCFFKEPISFSLSLRARCLRAWATYLFIWVSGKICFSQKVSRKSSCINTKRNFVSRAVRVEQNLSHERHEGGTLTPWWYERSFLAQPFVWFYACLVTNRHNFQCSIAADTILVAHVLLYRHIFCSIQVPLAVYQNGIQGVAATQLWLSL